MAKSVVSEINWKNKNVCAVTTCSKPYTKDIVFHSFPKDVDQQEIWLAFCHREGKVNVKTARVCSRHFAPEAYERDLQAELLHVRPRRRLTMKAIPTLHAPIDIKYGIVNTTQEVKEQSISYKSIVEDLLAASAQDERKCRVDASAQTDNVLEALIKQVQNLKERLAKKDRQVNILRGRLWRVRKKCRSANNRTRGVKKQTKFP